MRVCVLYSTLKRIIIGNKTKKTVPDELVLDCRNHPKSPEQMHVKLFPHIREIAFTPDIANKGTKEAIERVLNGWTVLCTTGNKRATALPVHTVSLYAELGTAFETLPDEIRIALDDPLLGLLNIKPPVQSDAGNATYVLTKDTTQTILLQC